MPKIKDPLRKWKRNQLVLDVENRLSMSDFSTFGQLGTKSINKIQKFPLSTTLIFIPPLKTRQPILPYSWIGSITSQVSVLLDPSQPVHTSKSPVLVEQLSPVYPGLHWQTPSKVSQTPLKKTIFRSVSAVFRSWTLLDVSKNSVYQINQPTLKLWILNLFDEY